MKPYLTIYWAHCFSPRSRGVDDSDEVYFTKRIGYAARKYDLIRHPDSGADHYHPFKGGTEYCDDSDKPWITEPGHSIAGGPRLLEPSLEVGTSYEIIVDVRMTEQGSDGDAMAAFFVVFGMRNNLLTARCEVHSNVCLLETPDAGDVNVFKIHCLGHNCDYYIKLRYGSVE